MDGERLIGLKAKLFLVINIGLICFMIFNCFRQDQNAYQLFSYVNRLGSGCVIYISFLELFL